VRKLMRADSVVYIVDDDESVRESLVELLLSAGLPTEAFASAEEFLARSVPERAVCLILDVTMPGMSGPELQERLLRDARGIPIVFITAMSEERVRTRVLERGALAWLVKPFGDEELLGAVQIAIDRERV
jgi:FixJ family two-component response regulator